MTLTEMAVVAHAPYSSLHDATVNTLEVPWVPRHCSVHNDQDWKRNAALGAVAITACASNSKYVYVAYIEATKLGAKFEDALPTSLDWCRPPRAITVEPVTDQELQGASLVDDGTLFAIRLAADDFATTAANASARTVWRLVDALDGALLTILANMSTTQLRSVAVRLQRDNRAGCTAPLFAFGQEERQCVAELVLDASPSNSNVSDGEMQQRMENLAGTLHLYAPLVGEHSLEMDIDQNLITEVTRSITLCNTVVQRHRIPPPTAFNKCVQRLEGIMLRVKGHAIDTTAARVAILAAFRSALHVNRLLSNKTEEEHQQRILEDERVAEEKLQKQLFKQWTQECIRQEPCALFCHRKDPNGTFEAAGRTAMAHPLNAPG